MSIVDADTGEIVVPSTTIEPLSQAERLLARAVDLVDIVEVIDLAAAARELAARAKLGLAAQNHAALIKLKAERKAGEVTAQLERGKGGNPNLSTGGRVESEYARTLEEVGVSRQQANRWQQIAENFTDDDLDREATAAIERAEELTQAQLLRAAKGPVHVTNNSGDVEWYTPPAFIEAAREVMGAIDLDPASCHAANKFVKADVFYDQNDNGLTKEWSGRVWMNPPYASGSIDKFCDKLRASYVSDSVSEACVLVNNATETGWFVGLARVANAFCFVSPRIQFWRPDRTDTKTGLQGQVVLYFGENVEKFRITFEQFGWTAVP